MQLTPSSLVMPLRAKGTFSMINPSRTLTFPSAHAHPTHTHHHSNTPSTTAAPALAPGAASPARADTMASLRPVAEETKAEQHMQHTARNVHPFEMEEGRPVKPDPMVQRTPDRKHCTKFACCWVFLSLVLILGILTAVFYPKKPHVSLYRSSLLEIDGFTGATATFIIKIDNKNHYALAFRNLVADVHDFDGIKIGTVTRPERFEVNARSSGLMNTTGVFQASLPQIGLVGLNCLANALETEVQIKTTADLRLFWGTRKIFSSVTERVSCSVRNVGGGMRGGVPGPRTVAPAAPATPVAPAAFPPVAGTPPPLVAPAAPTAPRPIAGANPPPPPPPPPPGATVLPPGAAPAPPAPTIADQIQNAINQGINNVFGGGGGGGAGAGGAAASP